MQLQWPWYYYKYARVGHQQISAFCSTDWVRSRDQFTRQQADFYVHHFFISTTIYPLTTRRKCGNHDATEGQSRMEKGQGRVYQVRPLYFYYFFSIILTIVPPLSMSPPPSARPSPYRHVPSPNDTSPTPTPRPHTRQTGKTRPVWRVFRVWPLPQLHLAFRREDGAVLTTHAPQSCFDATVGLSTHPTPPLCQKMQWWAFRPIPPLCCVKTRNGGLLCPAEAPVLHFDAMEGYSDPPPPLSCVPTPISCFGEMGILF